MDLDHLLTEARNPASANLDAMSAIEIVRLMNAEDSTVAAAVATQADAIAHAVDVIVERMQRGGRLIYVGAGTSGRLGVLDASECPPTFNSPIGQVVGVIAGGPKALTTAVEGAEDHPEFADADLLAINLNENDVLVGIATSGRTPYVIGALRYARAVGAYPIGLACVAESELASEAEIMIAPIVGPEILTGSTRLKAGTATKLVLNMLSTATMVRLGKAFGNLMVDLRATNIKLKARTNRIARQVLGINSTDANALLERCSGELKTAIVVGKTGVSPEEARQRLQAARGRIAEVLQDAKLPVFHANLIVGVDGGGTHTRALLAEMVDGQPRMIGRGDAGPGNMHAFGAAAAFANIDRAIDAAFAAAGIQRGRVQVACLGLAGAGRADDQEAARQWAERVGLADSIEITGDVELPIYLLPKEFGAIIIAGTGSCVMGRSMEGRTARAGGWGPLLGDEGSGYAIAVSALRWATQVADRRSRSTALMDRLLLRMDIEDPKQLVRAVAQWDRAQLACLASEVIAAADAGDDAAQSILVKEITSLAECVDSVVRELNLERTSLPLALAGGLLIKAPTYRDRLLTAIIGLGISTSHVVEVPEPAEGALRRAAGIFSRMLSGHA